jgi:hypothetical protein
MWYIGLYIGMVNNNLVRFGVESNWMFEVLLFSVCEYMGDVAIRIRHSLFVLWLFSVFSQHGVKSYFCWGYVL